MSEELIIDLDKLDSDEPLEENSYIYQGFLDYLHAKIIGTAKANKAFIERQLRKQSGKPKFHIHQHPCFFINGGRGTGKSTLLRGIKEKLINKKNSQQHDISIGLLAEIDPTELADGESFIVHMLSRIWERIDAVPFEGLQNSTITGARARATKCLQEMSKGLQLLAGTQDSLSKSYEASFFIEECVEQCASGTALKNKFCELLEHLSDITGDDAFLVTVDDADMNFSKCSEVMEKVRQYMLSPRIIFIFAGDIKLYSLVVRGMQLKHFGERELIHDDSRRAHRAELLNNLEDQYLMKLFPAGNRITLINSQGLLNRTGKTLLQTEAGTTYELGKALHHYLRHVVSKEHMQIAKSLLGSMPIRSILQLFKYWMSNIPMPMESNSSPHMMGEQELRKLSNGLRLTSTQALIQHQIDYISIHEGDLHALHQGVLQHIAHLGTDSECPRLLPNIGANDDKLVSLYIGSEVARLLNTPAKQIQYLYTIFPHLQYVMDELQGAKNGIAAPDVDLDDIFAENLMDRWNHAGNIEYRQWGARCTAYMSAKSKSGSNTEKRYARGTIRLMKKPQAAKVVAGRPKKEKLIYQHRESAKQTIVAIKKLITSADANSRNDADRDKIIQPLLALYHSISTIRSNEGFSYYLSIYNLISLMIELLETLSYIEDNDARKKAISEILYPKDLGFPEYAEEMTSLGTGKEDDNTEEEESKTEDVPEGRQENRPQDSRYDIHQTFAEIIKAQINASEQSLNELRNEIDGWAQTAVHSDGLVFPARMNDIWNHFFTRCSTITEEARLRARSEDDLVKAGDLFCSYMEAFETSVRLGLPDNTSNTVKDFPLWKALRALSGSNPELNNNLAGPANDSSTPAKDDTPTTKSLIPQLKDIINNLNIGPVTQVSPSA